jgi:hypothetical protein
VRYDYSSTPSHNLEGTTPPKLKKLEWQNEFNKDVERTKDIGLEFDSSHQRMKDGQEMEHDSGIESNDHDDSHCDLSLSQVLKILKNACTSNNSSLISSN